MAYEFAGIDQEDALWYTPLARVGWAIAVGLRRKGVKGISRKKDFGSALKRIRELIEQDGDTAPQV